MLTETTLTSGLFRISYSSLSRSSTLILCPSSKPLISTSTNEGMFFGYAINDSFLILIKILPPCLTPGASPKTLTGMSILIFLSSFNSRKSA